MSFQTNTLHLVSLTIVCSTWAQLRCLITVFTQVHTICFCRELCNYLQAWCEGEPSEKGWTLDTFLLVHHDHQGLRIINTANYKPDNYPFSNVYGNDLAGLNNDLTCPLYAYSVGKNKQSGYAWSNNYTNSVHLVW